VHDANIVATMLANGIARLLTFNVTDFRRFADLVAVETP
jgi:predicted nucleic acid-binding protein